MSLFKNKLPLLAAIAGVACAVGTTAFTTASNPPATYTFAYQPTSFDQDQVENVANWEIGAPNCDGDNRACEIVVDEQYTHLDDDNNRLLNDSLAAKHVTIVATEGALTGNYKVSKNLSENITSAANKD